jgi:hypothetical protein
MACLCNFAQGGAMPSEWTINTLKEHFEALRAADQRALQIKETADLAALQLAREIQTYKDEKANELREQINSERGEYATNKDVEPLKAFVASQTGRAGGIGTLATILFSAAMVIVAAAGVIVAIVLRS